MAYVTASEFVYIPAQSDGTTVRVESQRGNRIACFCDCGCGNFAADDFCTQCYNDCVGYGDEFPDGYGGFGASHCACGELTVNCDGKCQYVAETAPEVEPSFEDYLARRMEPRDPATVAWLEDFPF